MTMAKSEREQVIMAIVSMMICYIAGFATGAALYALMRGV
jgi:hypothetical protein